MEYAEELLKDSVKYKKYNEFNDVIPPSDYENSFSEALRVETSNSIIKDICGKLAGNLTKISKSEENEIHKQESCGFLHFWLYYELSKIFRGNKEETEIQSLISNVISGWKIFNDHISDYSCSGRFSPDIKLEKWIEGKHLHDYFKNFNYLSNTQYFKNNKCEQYKKYIGDINTLYDKHKSEYYDTDISRYLSDYSSDEYNPFKLISELRCENEKSDMDLQPHQQAPAREVMEQDNSVSLIQREAAQGDGPADSNSSSIVGSSASLIGMFVCFFTAYKFTPLGSWIYGKIWKKEKIQNNIDNITNSLLDDHSEYMDINHNSSTFNVAYNPT
ncbi:PIR Superfamily Protein [Plasmodium ovale wallikeri]|uniref:PIR Superfamily Protein n=1 Tax=Plasmodium ovale wallikeri TaxID=864142 RepID=A0A1A9AIH8_PLAOA|nr:PIR Superfamily Protein [Plasmodium ovale wallikeri]SBT58829.1 PIR Superfamily Protein [Plasmodium ovale wallikeri]